MNHNERNAAHESCGERVELHLHTKMSPRDALISPEEAVRVAKERGQRAVAITDHGGVWAFPEAMRASLRYGIKILYGAELNFKPNVENTGSDSWGGYHLTVLAKDRVGLKNLYRLISLGNWDSWQSGPPIYTKEQLDAHREGLLFGSGCNAGELFCELWSVIAEGTGEAFAEREAELVSYYDYLEIMPVAHSRHFIELGLLESEEEIRELNRRIVALGEKYNKPVVASSNAHILNEEDEMALHVLTKGKDAGHDLCFLTTEQMLEEFSYLGQEKAYEVVVENPCRISDMIEQMDATLQGVFDISVENARNRLQTACFCRARELYGDGLNETVLDRLYSELDAIAYNDSATLFLLAGHIAATSEQLGYRVGTRGCVGSSFVAYLLGLTDINPLPPHYRCPQCHHTEFVHGDASLVGLDLPRAACPHCNHALCGDGYNIPCESLFGFCGDRFPYIAINVAPELQDTLSECVADFLGCECVKAGTVGKIAEKKAWSLTADYIKRHDLSLSMQDATALSDRLCGSLIFTSIHPGSVVIVPRGYDIHDFTPTREVLTDNGKLQRVTQFTSEDLLGTLCKIDILQSSPLSDYRKLEALTGVNVKDVPLDDERVLALFTEGGTQGLPEFGTPIACDVLRQTKPASVSDLIKISGLLHSTDAWCTNAENLLCDGVCTLSQVVSSRDDIMLTLLSHGMDRYTAFTIMEHVRKGKGLTEQQSEAMRACGIEEWYIASCRRIRYLFPKAHAVAYVMMALRFGYYKVYHGNAFERVMSAREDIS